MNSEVSIYLYLNSVCNLNCRYCYVQKKANWQLNLDLVKKKLSYFLDKGSFLFITFSGGEPLLNIDELKSLVDYIEKKSAQTGCGYDLRLLTNGTLLTKEIADFLIAHKVKIVLSLDGSASANDFNRLFKSGSQSVFGAIMDNLQTMDASIVAQLQISKVITPQNLETLAEDFSFINDYGFGSIDFQFENYILWPQTALEKLPIVFQRLEKNYQQLFAQPDKNPIIINNLEAILNAENHRLANCDKFRITGDGQVFLCQAYLNDYQQLKNKSLAENDLWTSKQEMLAENIRQLTLELGKTEDPGFCPIDLLVYCCNHNLDFKKYYYNFKQLQEIMRSMGRQIIKELSANDNFKQKYHLN